MILYSDICCPDLICIYTPYPCSYPAGFVYIYSGLYYLTNQGADVALAQWIFAGLYLANLTAVLLIVLQLNRTQHYPPYMLAFLGCTAYRIHSIFVLRLFNDPVAMFLLHVAVLLFMNHSWTVGCAVYRYETECACLVQLFCVSMLQVACMLLLYPYVYV